MSRKRRVEKRALASSRSGRVVCADGCSRMILLANTALLCGECGMTIEIGNRFTMRRMSERPDNNRYPVCQRCGPFGNGTRVQMRRAMAVTVGRVKALRNDVQEAI